MFLFSYNDIETEDCQEKNERSCYYKSDIVKKLKEQNAKY